MNKHHGQIIERTIRINGYNMSEAARELKIDRRTFYNWFKKKNLKDEIILKLGKVFRYDFSEEFPEVYARAKKTIPLNISANNMADTNSYIDELTAVDWRNKYIELLEKHTDLLSKNIFHNEKK